eukprot:GHVQ01024640.1.p1 GENE.GHVQ01024640.1~~GHVQ01024640.1.p1  ORF type:complete len:945 (-),score=99.05 GHVQ01024640.1:119-2953(-)
MTFLSSRCKLPVTLLYLAIPCLLLLHGSTIHQAFVNHGGGINNTTNTCQDAEGIGPTIVTARAEEVWVPHSKRMDHQIGPNPVVIDLPRKTNASSLSPLSVASNLWRMIKSFFGGYRLVTILAMVTVTNWTVSWETAEGILGRWGLYSSMACAMLYSRKHYYPPILSDKTTLLPVSFDVIVTVLFSMSLDRCLRKAYVCYYNKYYNELDEVINPQQAVAGPVNNLGPGQEVINPQQAAVDPVNNLGPGGEDIDPQQALVGLENNFVPVQAQDDYEVPVGMFIQLGRPDSGYYSSDDEDEMASEDGYHFITPPVRGCVLHDVGSIVPRDVPTECSRQLKHKMWVKDANDRPISKDVTVAVRYALRREGSRTPIDVLIDYAGICKIFRETLFWQNKDKKIYRAKICNQFDERINRYSENRRHNERLGLQMFIMGFNSKHCRVILFVAPTKTRMENALRIHEVDSIAEGLPYDRNMLDFSSFEKAATNRCARKARFFAPLNQFGANRERDGDIDIASDSEDDEEGADVCKDPPIERDRVYHAGAIVPRHTPSVEPDKILHRLMIVRSVISLPIKSKLAQIAVRYAFERGNGEAVTVDIDRGKMCRIFRQTIFKKLHWWDKNTEEEGHSRLDGKIDCPGFAEMMPAGMGMHIFIKRFALHSPCKVLITVAPVKQPQLSPLVHQLANGVVALPFNDEVFDISEQAKHLLTRYALRERVLDIASLSSGVPIPKWSRDPVATVDEPYNLAPFAVLGDSEDIALDPPVLRDRTRDYGAIVPRYTFNYLPVKMYKHKMRVVETNAETGDRSRPDKYVRVAVKYEFARENGVLESNDINTGWACGLFRKTIFESDGANITRIIDWPRYGEMTRALKKDKGLGIQAFVKDFNTPDCKVLLLVAPLHLNSSLEAIGFIFRNCVDNVQELDIALDLLDMSESAVASVREYAEEMFYE